MSKPQFRGTQRREFLPGVGGFSDGRSGIHALVTAGAADSGFKFSFPLSLNGSLAVYFVPFAETTSVQLTSNSPNPDFQGSWLPAERAISQNGFDATWRISYLGRNYSQSWISGAIPGKAIDDSRFGVQLIEPIDRYRMAERSVKYAGLFILLTFAFVWLIEVMAGTRVHPIQYLMLGAALCVFICWSCLCRASEFLTSPMESRRWRYVGWLPHTAV